MVNKNFPLTKKIIHKLLWVCCFLSFAVSSNANEKTIKLATLDWQPYVGKSLENGGFTTAIITEALNSMGYQTEVSYMPWARVLSQTDAGKYDGAYPAYYSEERTKKYFLSDSFAKGPLGFYKRKDQAINYNKLEDLKGFKIGTVRGYVNTKLFDAADYLTKKPENSDLANLKKLLKKRVDLVVIDKFTARHLINQKLKGTMDLEFLDPPLETKSLHVAFSKVKPENEAINQQFNKTLERMKSSGRIEEILAEYGMN